MSFGKAVCFIVDANYFAMGLAQAKRCLAMSAEDVEIHVFFEGDEAETADEATCFEAIQAASSGRLVLHRRALSHRVPDSFPHTPTLPKLVYGRFYVPDLIEAEKILYLDVDILIRHPIAPLFEVDLGEAAVAAVHDYGFIDAGGSKGEGVIAQMRHGGGYFNAGVLLINRSAWRAYDLSALSHDFFAQHGAEASLQDQDFLNWLLQSRWVQLSPRWNYQAALLEVGLDRAIDPAIVHFSGSLKPWHPESRSVFTAYAADYAAMMTEADAPLDWRPRRGRVAYARPLDRLKHSLFRAIGAAGLMTPKMKRRLAEWGRARERRVALIVERTASGAFADRPAFGSFEEGAPPVYDGRRYWSASS